MARCEYPSPVGVLTLVASDDGLQGVWWPDDPRRPGSGPEQPDHPVLARTMRQLDEYFAGTRTEFDIPLDPGGTDFQRAAWGVLRTIPYAQTITYGEQARRLGDPARARAAGAANGRNPLSIVVPCHRVVGAGGALTGFGGGLDSIRWLLDFERCCSERAALHS